jgi:folate-binding protein YgfZ
MCSATATPSDPSGESPATTSDWSRFLASQVPGRTGTPETPSASELEYLQAGCVVCDLSDRYSVLEAVGPDSRAFLHGQLSSDVAGLGPERAQLSTYNTPKGRVLATLLLWSAAEGFLLQIPASAAASIAKRLSMFVLRSKVRLTVSERYIVFGLTGATAPQTLAAAGIAVPGTDFGLVSAGAMDAPDRSLRLPGGRYQLILSDAERAIALWQRLCSAGAHVGSGAAWQWASIRSGIAEIEAETQDQLVPQMLNYDVLDGVSFTKGCYPGQEIVARTQYLGGIKRRTLLLHAQTQDAPVPAQSVHAVRSPDQPIGMVLGAAAAPAGGFDVLACVHLELAENSDLRLGAADGPALHRLELPYALPASR